jgi:hypothetical protein
VQSDRQTDGQTGMSKSLFAILRKRLKCLNIPYNIFFADAENSEVCTLKPGDPVDGHVVFKSEAVLSSLL